MGTLTGHSSSVNSVLSHPSGRLTLTASSDRTVKVCCQPTSGCAVLRCTQDRL